MMIVRPIQSADNSAVAHVIRTVMPEFNCVGEGFSINDPEVENMADAYGEAGSAFFVIEVVGTSASSAAGAGAGAKKSLRAKIVGCGGYAPLSGADGSVCELRKMYILPEGRGLGGGRKVMDACLEGARAAGYTQMYLETVAGMTTAAAVYQKYGFEYLDGPMGNTGHSGCDKYMIRNL